ncbi:MAG: phosphoribosylamine--glycine ligase, partial [Elusimicrobiota bacterium]|nr:phosphoribosylamine--glycine ligase [Elusimicrobiota bacterium]
MLQRNNILVVGSGGREHALVWKISQSSKVNRIYCIPGNAGIAQIAECVSIPINDFKALGDFVKQKNIDLTVVGPEQPLADGIVDYFRAESLRIIGPTKTAAQLESSKSYAKLFMKKYNIPTGSFEIFDNYDQAISYLSAYQPIAPPANSLIRLAANPPTRSHACVVKADGLCGGKGVTVCDTVDEAKQVVYNLMMKKIFGDAGKKVIVEEKLIGLEASLQAFCDGKTILPMIPSQDHKRVFDGDLGQNTGGMGAYAPTSVV